MPSNCIAVALIHGMGDQKSDFADQMVDEIEQRVRREAKAADAPRPDLVFEPIYWADVLKKTQDELLGRLSPGTDKAFGLRKFLVTYGGDVIAYQRTPSSSVIHDEIHVRMARALRRLAARAGPAAPLVVIGHSLGTVIASNYLYDLQARWGPYYNKERPVFIAGDVLREIGDTPLEHGDTLAQMHTMGSPLALWSMQGPVKDGALQVGRPVIVPAPTLLNHHAGLAATSNALGWINYHDPDDIIAFPLSKLSGQYELAVKEDKPVAAGGLLTGSTVLCHEGYWGSDNVLTRISGDLANAWIAMNPPSP